jgi:hypothetical protein
MKMTLKLSIITFFYVLLIKNLSAQLYVDNSYTGENQSGSSDAPFTTIQKAVDNAKKGDNVLIKRGVYREQVNVGVDSITIQPFRDHKVVVNGTEPLLNWEKVSGEVYKAIVPWEITENDQSDQIFVDGSMMHLARWPKESNPDWMIDATVSYVDKAENSGRESIIITDNEFDEPSERWLDGMVWVNLAHDHDGNGWLGKATYIIPSLNQIKISPIGSGVHAASGHDPWAVQKGSEYYLLNPAPEGVYATGGPGALLARGEWWKNGDTLFVRLPNGEEPASSENSKNLVEAKKRNWAFIPKESDLMHHVTIKGIHLFAASISTDKSYNRGNLAVNSHHNVIDSIQAKYLMHFIDVSGHYGLQWKGRCGIILSGVENTLKNSILQYSAGAAVSAFGERHKILNNRFYDINYQCTESGTINGGSSNRLIDPEIAYNLLYNSLHIGIAVGNMYSSNPEEIGLIRIHHNVFMNFMLRSSDGGAINCSAGRNWDNLRADHNIIANANNFIAIGIYTDYGGEALFDHNVIRNVNVPIGMNRYSEDRPAPIGSSDSGPMGEIRVYNNTAIADSWHGYGIHNNHVNGSGEGMYYKNNIVSNRIKATLELAEVVDSNLYIEEDDVHELFVDFENNNLQLASTAHRAIDMGTDASPYNDTIINDVPDIGAFEYGAEPWTAGPDGVVTNISISSKDNRTVYQNDTIQFDATAFTSGFIKMNPQPEMSWWTNGCGSINNQGIFIADTAMEHAKIFVTADSLLVASHEFDIKEKMNSFVNNDVKMKEEDTFILKAFPNPAREFINIHIPHCKDSGNSPAVIAIFDTNMKCLEKYQHCNSLNKPCDGRMQFPVSGLKPGFYFIKVHQGKKVYYSKILISN